MAAGRGRWLLGAALLALLAGLVVLTRLLVPELAPAHAPAAPPRLSADRPGEAAPPTFVAEPGLPAPPPGDPLATAQPASLTPTGAAASLEPRHEVRLVVVDEDARPVPEALVQVLRVGPPSQPRFLAPDEYQVLQEMRTDAQGRASLLLDRDGDHVQASSRGLGRSERLAARVLEAHQTLSGEVVVRLRPDVVVQGRVRGVAGGPAPGVAVECFGMRTGVTERPDVQRATSAAPDGTFRFVLESCSRVVAVAIAKDGHRTEQKLDVPPDGRLDVTLDLSGAWWIRGEVLDEAGQRLPGACVAIYHGAGLVDAWESLAPGQEGDGPAWFRASDAGVFEHRAGVLEPHLLAAARSEPRSPPSDPVLVALDAERTDAWVTLRLPRPASITGRVRDSGGAPVGGATVSLRTSGPPALEVIESGIVGPWQLKKPELAAETTTTDDGGFALTGLHPHGTFDLLVTPPGATGMDARQLALEGVRAWASGLDVVVPPSPRPKTGRILLSVRAAATGEQVVVRSLACVPEGQPALAVRSAPKDNDGEITIPELVAGQAYTVTVTAAGLSSVTTHHLVAAESPQAVIVELPPLGNLQVLVLDEQGHPLPYAEVRARRSQPAAGFRAAGKQDTNVDGLVLFTGLDAGSVRVTVTVGGDETEGTVEVRPDATASLLLAVQRD